MFVEQILEVQSQLPWFCQTSGFHATNKSTHQNKQIHISIQTNPHIKTNKSTYQNKQIHISKQTNPPHIKVVDPRSLRNPCDLNLVLYLLTLWLCLRHYKDPSEFLFDHTWDILTAPLSRCNSMHLVIFGAYITHKSKF